MLRAEALLACCLLVASIEVWISNGICATFVAMCLRTGHVVSPAPVISPASGVCARCK